MKVPFLNLVLQHQTLRDEIEAAVSRVVSSASFILGSEVQQFEEELAAYVGATHSVGVSSGTDALILAFKLLGLAPGDEVIVPAHTFVATAIGVLQGGGRPVLVDVDPHTGLLDLDRAEAAITSRTKAICPVHLYGRVCDMDRLCALAERHGLQIVEDAAQSHGARWNGRQSGTWGSMGCFSFYPGKNLGACGDAGAIVTDSAETAAQLRRMRNYGSEQKYCYPGWGTNARLDSIQAAILRVKLPRLTDWNSRRYRMAARYTELFRNAQIADVIPPELPPAENHSFHLYVIRHPQRDRLRQWLQENGVETGIHYPNPFHLEPAFAHLGYVKGSFPVTEKLAGEILSLPMFPELRDEEAARVVELIGRFPG